jgi:hypothetical protein
VFVIIVHFVQVFYVTVSTSMDLKECEK